MYTYIYIYRERERERDKIIIIIIISLGIPRILNIKELAAPTLTFFLDERDGAASKFWRRSAGTAGGASGGCGMPEAPIVPSGPPAQDKCLGYAGDGQGGRVWKTCPG